jgi:integrase
MRRTRFAVATTKTCADAFRRYELEVSKAKRGYNWEAGRNAMSATPLGKVRMSDLNASHIAAWRDMRLREVQGGTVTGEMNLLSHVCSVARKEWKWHTNSPTTDVARPRANPARDRRITPAEIEKLCLALNWHQDAIGVAPETKQQRIALAFLGAIETAMRASEICALHEGDVQGSVARLHQTKKSFREMFPFPRERWKFGHWFHKNSGSQQLRSTRCSGCARARRH